MFYAVCSVEECLRLLADRGRQSVVLSSRAVHGQKVCISVASNEAFISLPIPSLQECLFYILGASSNPLYNRFVVFIKVQERFGGFLPSHRVFRKERVWFAVSLSLAVLL